MTDEPAAEGRDNGTQAAERFGPTAADRRRAERRAAEIEREIRNGRLGLAKRERRFPRKATCLSIYEKRRAEFGHDLFGRQVGGCQAVSTAVAMSAAWSS